MNQPGWGLGTESTTQSSSGYRAIQISSSGWVEFVSPDFSTSDLPAIGGRLTLDIMPPSPAPNPYWAGDVQVWLSCPEIDLTDEWIGWQTLNGLFENEYNTIAFDLPIDILDALETPGLTCQFRFAINTAVSSQPSSYSIDRIGFAD
jgi:hypothetical protein